jgi:hypothetical protein
MDYSREKMIADQALKALQIRRQRERGALTEQEYVQALNALQGAEAPDMSDATDPASSAALPEQARPKPKSLNALEALQLRRELEPGQLTAKDYLEQLEVHPVAGSPEFSRPAPRSVSCEVTQAYGLAAIVAPVATPERFLTMKCPGCAVNLKIYDHLTELNCSDCEALIQVERKDCTIALRLVENVSPEPSPDAISAQTARSEEIRKLQAEEAMMMMVKRIAGIVGVPSCGAIGYVAIAEMTTRDGAMGVSILLLASALFATVYCITRHTNKVRAELSARIRAMSASAEGLKGLP